MRINIKRKERTIIEIAVKFDSTGKWLETESAASWFMVPSLVQDSIAKRFKGYKVVRDPN
jgi:hypothetical protein